MQFSSLSKVEVIARDLTFSNNYLSEILILLFTAFTRLSPAQRTSNLCFEGTGN